MSQRTFLDYEKLAIKMVVNSQAELDIRATACKKEPWTVAFIETMRRGDVLWDIGANVGSYSLIAAARGNDVVAVEPILANFHALLANGNINQLPGRIHAVNVALGATIQRIAFAQDGIPGHVEGGVLTLDVQQVTLDELATTPALPQPTHIKIDVDGHELAVLAGAERVIRDSALQAMLIESKRSLGERIADLLDNWGWRRTQIHERRDGKFLKNVRYEEFMRKPVSQLIPDPTTFPSAVTTTYSVAALAV